MEIYPIFDGAIQVGKARIQREGLYLLIQCRCVPLCRKPRRLYMQAGENVIPLGLCVPDGQEMSLLKRVPAGKIGDSKPSFHIEGSQQRGVLFRPGEPFVGMAQLHNAKLQICDGAYYILIAEPSSSNSTGQ